MQTARPVLFHLLKTQFHLGARVSHKLPLRFSPVALALAESCAAVQTAFDRLSRDAHQKCVQIIVSPTSLLPNNRLGYWSVKVTSWKCQLISSPAIFCCAALLVLAGMRIGKLPLAQEGLPEAHGISQPKPFGDHHEARGDTGKMA
ncbi:hypothetical protein GGR53DRAFT_466981 [Hypoxylon sp. FL1150]|nr:hypothetical protein GGR53DRAFT_466981 [Hypoxylon sp. FL1150]